MTQRTKGLLLWQNYWSKDRLHEVWEVNLRPQVPAGSNVNLDCLYFIKYWLNDINNELYYIWYFKPGWLTSPSNTVLHAYSITDILPKAPHTTSSPAEWIETYLKGYISGNTPEPYHYLDDILL